MSDVDLNHNYAQLFNCSVLKKRIKDGTLEFPPEPLWEGGEYCNTFTVSDVDLYLIMHKYLTAAC